MRHVEEQERLRNATDRSFVGKYLLAFALVIGVLLAFLMAPTILRSKKKMDMTQAISNSKQVYLCLIDFESDHGHFPDDRTAVADPRLHGFQGAASNRYLGQLIAGEYTKSEEIFYAFDARSGRKKPDDNIHPPSNILEKNECGFSYVMVEEKGRKRGLSTGDNGGLPMLAAVLVNPWGSFEKKSYQGRGIYLRVDGSARSERLHMGDQKIVIAGGGTLFDSTGIWGAMKPMVLLPER